jgi:hypothetical protein
MSATGVGGPAPGCRRRLAGLAGVSNPLSDDAHGWEKGRQRVSPAGPAALPTTSLTRRPLPRSGAGLLGIATRPLARWGPRFGVALGALNGAWSAFRIPRDGRVPGTARGFSFDWSCRVLSDPRGVHRGRCGWHGPCSTQELCQIRRGMSRGFVVACALLPTTTCCVHCASHPQRSALLCGLAWH